MQFPVKVRDIHKIEKKNSISICVFGYEKKENHPIFVSKKYEEKHIDLLLIGEEGNRTMFWSKMTIYSCMIIL